MNKYARGIGIWLLIFAFIFGFAFMINYGKQSSTKDIEGY